MLCRFEDRLSGEALEMDGYSHRIAAHARGELPAAFAQIQSAQDHGCWVALLLNYELGEWLEPAFSSGASTGALAPAASTDSARSTSGDTRPAPPGSPPVDGPPALLTALVYRQAHKRAVWDAPAHSPQRSLDVRPLIEQRRYLDNIQTLRDSIGRGELYQANYTMPIAIESPVGPQALYRHIATKHPTAHAAYIEDGQRRILSFSPELFFARRGTTLTVRPMKGTAPRHADPLQDAAAGQALLRSEKNRAENVMIVDLLRNDLGRLATPGSVKVGTLFSLEKYPSVWTLTSTITAEAPHASLQDLLRALFPCGSITGAPKIAAMQKIKALETTPRGIYCGSVGWLAPDGDCSLNVAIRTIEMRDERHGIFGVGGGIVYDSDPALEWEECLWKARILGAQALEPA
jgi:para-aminobenzoate synthetase component 1